MKKYAKIIICCIAIIALVISFTMILKDSARKSKANGPKAENTKIVESNKDEYDHYDKVSTLKKQDNASTTMLVKFNNNLYGMSNAVIDYVSKKDPIGTITKLIDSEYIPKENGETNFKDLLNAKVYEGDSNTIVLQYHNEFVMFEKIEM